MITEKRKVIIISVLGLIGLCGLLFSYKQRVSTANTQQASPAKQTITSKELQTSSSMFDHNGRYQDTTTTATTERQTLGWRGIAHTLSVKDEHLASLERVEHNGYFGSLWDKGRHPKNDIEKQAALFAEAFIDKVYSWSSEPFDTHINQLLSDLSQRGKHYLTAEFLKDNPHYVYADKKAYFIDSVVQDDRQGFYEEFKQYKGVVLRLFGLGRIKRSNGLIINEDDEFHYLILVNRQDNGQWQVDYFEPLNGTEK